MRLSELERDAVIDVPIDAGAQIQEMARQFPLGMRFIIDQLAGKDRMVYRPLEGMDPATLMAWLDGRRYVGLQLARIIATPIEVPREPEPPARTMTEAALRREMRDLEG